MSISKEDEYNEEMHQRGYILVVNKKGQEYWTLKSELNYPYTEPDKKYPKPNKYYPEKTHKVFDFKSDFAIFKQTIEDSIENPKDKHRIQVVLENLSEIEGWIKQNRLTTSQFGEVKETLEEFASKPLSTDIKLRIHGIVTKIIEWQSQHHVEELELRNISVERIKQMNWELAGRVDKDKTRILHCLQELSKDELSIFLKAWKQFEKNIDSERYKLVIISNLKDLIKYLSPLYEHGEKLALDSLLLLEKIEEDLDYFTVHRPDIQDEDLHNLVSEATGLIRVYYQTIGYLRSTAMEHKRFKEEALKSGDYYPTSWQRTLELSQAVLNEFEQGDIDRTAIEIETKIKGLGKEIADRHNQYKDIYTYDEEEIRKYQQRLSYHPEELNTDSFDSARHAIDSILREHDRRKESEQE